MAWWGAACNPLTSLIKGGEGLQMLGQGCLVRVFLEFTKYRYSEYSTTGPTNDSTGRSHVGTDVPYTYTSITQLVY